MGQTFTKLFSSITASTIWTESSNTRVVWITMLAMATAKGEVFGSIPGLAQIANVPLLDCQVAIDKFMGPDRYSRNEEHEGRRIVKIDGGWQLLNYLKFRELKNEEQLKEAKRVYMQNRRRKEKQTVQINASQVNVVTKKVES